MKGLVGVAVLLLLMATAVEAQELPPDLAPVGKAVEVEMGGAITDGDQRRMRELLRNPDWLWGAARAFVPLDSDRFWGQLRLEATTLGTGFLSLDAHASDGSHVLVRLSRSRFPFAAVTRVAQPFLPQDSGALGKLEESHESAELAYDRALGPLGGHIDAALDFYRIDGTRPLLAGGSVSGSPLTYVFGNAAYRDADDVTGGAHAGYSIVPGGIRLRIEGGVRFDRLDDRMRIRDSANGQAAGLADLHDHGRVRTFELAASAASDRPAALVGGVSYHLTHTANAPRVDRTLDQTVGGNGTIRSDDGDVAMLRQHGAGAVIWQPLPRLLLSGRLDARFTDLDGHATQARDLGSFETVRAASSRDNWSLDGRVEGRYGFLFASAVELEAKGQLRHGDDDWNLRYLLADGVTGAGARIRSLDRRLLAGQVELRLLARLLARVRATLGLHLEGLRDDEDVRQLVDAFRLGDRSRTRAGAFLSARSRLARRLALDGRATVFRNTWSTSAGGEDDNWRFDFRLRATVTAGPLMLFALGSLTEDRHDLSGGQAPPGFATLDFIGRSWVAVGGASATLGPWGWIAGTYTFVANTVDLTTRLHDAALTGNAMLPWRGLRLQLSARYLDFRDRAPVLADGKAILLLGTLAGSF